jgi:branched-chain amino acid transport system ATP-binding protein
MTQAVADVMAQALTQPALRTVGLGKLWGGFSANSDITFELAAGARHALIGPNGAGKTTFVNLLSGALQPSSGDVYLGGERVTALPQFARVKRGLARTFQINSLFAELTVLESTLLAICERTGAARHWWRAVADHPGEIDEGVSLLESLGLGQDLDCATRALPYGKQRLLEIALALATRPKILLLDEPAAGIPRAQSRELFEVLSRLPADVTILLIEHDMELVFQFAERITVLVGGRILAEGTPAAIASDARVREVYLGEADHG